MITTFANNFMAFILSVPINLIIIGIVCLILKIAGKTAKTVLKVFFGYFLICFLLSLLGLSLPSIPAIFNWLRAVGTSFISWCKGVGIW